MKSDWEMELYAVFCEEREGWGEKLVWDAGETATGRRWFYGGTGIKPCLYFAYQSAHSDIKKMHDDFKEGSQFFVRKVALTLR